MPSGYRRHHARRLDRQYRAPKPATETSGHARWMRHETGAEGGLPFFVRRKMARNTKKTTSFSLAPNLVERIEDRANNLNKSARLQVDLETYYCLLDHGLKQAQKVLSQAEVQAIVHVQRGVVESGRAAIYSASGGLEHRLQDANTMDDLGEKWGIDPSVLQAKLETLRGAPVLALLDWAVQMWSRHEDRTFWNNELNKFL